MPLDVHTEAGAEGPVVRVSGALDISTADRLEQALHAAEADAPEVLVLDLVGVGFFDSTGLQMVLDAHVRAGETGRRLMVVAGESEARRVFDLAEVSADLELR